MLVPVAVDSVWVSCLEDDGAAHTGRQLCSFLYSGVFLSPLDLTALTRAFSAGMERSRGSSHRSETCS